MKHLSNPGRPCQGGRSQRRRPPGSLRRLPSGVPADDQVRVRVRKCTLLVSHTLSSSQDHRRSQLLRPAAVRPAVSAVQVII